MTVEEVATEFPDSTLLVYDLSQPILDTEATYSPYLGMSFTVISACGARVDDVEAEIPLGVVPSVALTPSITDAAMQGSYDELLAECG